MGVLSCSLTTYIAGKGMIRLIGLIAIIGKMCIRDRIIGAGSAAEICISEMQKSGKYNIVGLIDDAAEKNMLILAESRFWVRAMKLTILPYPVM